VLTGFGHGDGLACRLHTKLKHSNIEWDRHSFGFQICNLDLNALRPNGELTPDRSTNVPAP